MVRDTHTNELQVNVLDRGQPLVRTYGPADTGPREGKKELLNAHLLNLRS
jgi:hypothetical protein